jgi:ABC-type dipeptide/oligopeptide/nickel transport system permease subunit
MGFFTALTLLFIVLKVTGYIALSWWWVLVPATAFVVIFVCITALAMKYPLMFIDRSKLK